MRVVKETDVKKINSFVIKVDMEHAGMETVKLLVDDMEIILNVAYDGEEFIYSMLESLNHFEFHGYDKLVLYNYTRGEQTTIETRRDDQIVHIEIEHLDHEFERYGINIRRYGVIIPFEVYRQSVIDAGLDVLRRYGNNGYSENWAIIGGTYFIGSLISALTSNRFSSVDEDDKIWYRSNIKEELQTLMDAL
jgi:hypothetical protein